jgi:hypothetical protein
MKNRGQPTRIGMHHDTTPDPSQRASARGTVVDVRWGFSGTQFTGKHAPAKPAPPHPGPRIQVCTACGLSDAACHTRA